MIAQLRRLIGRVPRAGRACFVIAFLNAAIWTVVVPPFQVPDETGHFAYAQYFAQTGSPPPQGLVPSFSPEEDVALGGLGFFTVIGHPDIRAVVTAGEDRTLRAVLATDPSPTGRGGVSPQSNQPPLYYALAAIPYWISPSHDILVRLELMRLLSALFAAGTVLCVFLFIRELFPAAPWMCVVGALAVAFQPQFMFIAAGVQSDNLLFFASSATFLALLRAHRRGLSAGRGAAIGAATAVGLLAKLTFVAFVPGIAAALALLTWRAARAGGRRRAVRAALGALGVAVVPVGVVALLNTTVWQRGSPTAGAFSGIVTAAGGVTINQSLDYIWQLYLPRLPFMNHVYFGGRPLFDVWLNGSIGRFGWLDYGFSPAVYVTGQRLLAVLGALALIAIARLRWERIKAVLPIFTAFLVMALGLLGAIGWEGIRYRAASGFQFEQARYLFPLLVFYGLAVALAASSAPRRWAPAVGGALVVLAMAHGLFAEALTISRYYG